MKTSYFLIRLLVLVICMCISGCGFIAGQLHDKAMEDQLLKPGALDLPLTGFYTHYQYKLLDSYQITHQWIRESNCDYRKVESRKYDGKDRFFNVRDIFEEGGSTWQRFDAKTGNFNFDQYVRPEYTVKTKNGLKTEKGYGPICFQSWWTTSNYIRLRLQKRPLNELITAFNERYPEGTWTTKTINNLTWHVQETPEDKFRLRPLNGVGGPFQSWLIPLADTGYTMAIELGASKESLQYPDVHTRMQAMFKHLIESVKIEPIPATSANTSQVPAESVQPASLTNQKNSEITGQPILHNNSSTSNSIREYPDKTQQLQQNMQRDSNRNMKNLLRNTTPKTGQ